MLEAAILKKYQMPRRPAFAFVAARALGWHRRLVAFLAALGLPAEGSRPASVTFDPNGLGERHLLWNTPGDFEFLRPWPGFFVASFLSDLSRSDQRTSARTRGSTGEATVSDRRESWPPHPAGLGFQGPGQGDRLALWPRMLHERHAPERWRGTDSRSEGKLGTASPERGRAIQIPPVFLPSFYETPAGHGAPEQPFAVLLGRDKAGPDGRHSPDTDFGRETDPQNGTAISHAGFVPSGFAVSRAPAGPSGEGTGARLPWRPEDFPAGTWRFFVSQSRGTPPGISQRVLLEPIFPGLNLAEVRIHRDEAADRASRSLGAQAFSLGRDIFFRAGSFHPATAQGLALLGHELEHTRQVISGGPVEAMRPAGELEWKAEAVEASLLAALAPPGTLQPEQPAAGWKGGGPAYAPLRLERERPLSHGTQGGSGLAGERLISLSALSGEATRSRPLKAEENRPAATHAGSAASSSSDDQDRLTRVLLRTLERKVRTDKERRGVDRWES